MLKLSDGNPLNDPTLSLGGLQQTQNRLAFSALGLHKGFGAFAVPAALVPGEIFIESGCEAVKTHPLFLKTVKLVVNPVVESLMDLDGNYWMVTKHHVTNNKSICPLLVNAMLDVVNS